jgi:hypothetical protein
MNSIKMEIYEAVDFRFLLARVDGKLAAELFVIT